MSMKHISLVLFSILIWFQVNAQSNTSAAGMGKISGKVTDAITKLPVDYATVSIYKQSSNSPFNGASTDPKGNFKLIIFRLVPTISP